MPYLADRVKDTCTTTGTGAITLAGSAPAGFRTFASGFGASSQLVNYCIQAQTPGEWEVGQGTFNGATGLTRDTVLASSNSNALVSFSAGTKDVFSTAPAAKIVDTDSAQLVAGVKDFGEAPNFTPPNAPMRVSMSVNGWMQLPVQNKGNGASASGDICVTCDDGSDTARYIDLGINSSAYSVGTWTISGPRDSYLMANDSSITIGTDTVGKTVAVHTGGTLLANIRLKVEDTRITPFVPILNVGAQIATALAYNLP